MEASRCHGRSVPDRVKSKLIVEAGRRSTRSSNRSRYDSGSASCKYTQPRTSRSTSSSHRPGNRQISRHDNRGRHLQMSLHPHPRHPRPHRHLAQQTLPPAPFPAPATFSGPRGRPQSSPQAASCRTPVSGTGVFHDPPSLPCRPSCASGYQSQRLERSGASQRGRSADADADVGCEARCRRGGADGDPSCGAGGVGAITGGAGVIGRGWREEAWSFGN